jgi:YD repeat-containing protein
VEVLDPLGRLDTVGDGGAVTIADYAYDDLNSFYTVLNANGVTDRFDYDALGRTSRVRTTGPGGAVFDLGYGYDRAGNPIYRQRLHAAGAPADVFQYDGLYRLREVHYDADSTDPAAITAFSKHQLYSLDLLGNRLALVENSVSQAYGPNDGLRLTDPLNRYRQVGAAALSYDPRGNLLNDGANSYTYDLLNRLIGVSN